MSKCSDSSFIWSPNEEGSPPTRLNVVKAHLFNLPLLAQFLLLFLFGLVLLLLLLHGFPVLHTTTNKMTKMRHLNATLPSFQHYKVFRRSVSPSLSGRQSAWPTRYCHRSETHDRRVRRTEQRQTVRPTDGNTHDLLAIVVGLEDVADGSAVTPPACWLQDETKQPLVVLMGRALEHGGERELQREREQTGFITKHVWQQKHRHRGTALVLPWGGWLVSEDQWACKK